VDEPEMEGHKPEVDGLMGDNSDTDKPGIDKPEMDEPEVDEMEPKVEMDGPEPEVAMDGLESEVEMNRPEPEVGMDIREPEVEMDGPESEVEAEMVGSEPEVVDATIALLFLIILWNRYAFCSSFKTRSGLIFAAMQPSYRHRWHFRRFQTVMSHCR
jgi:hypothetical protein